MHDDHEALLVVIVVLTALVSVLWTANYARWINANKREDKPWPSRGWQSPPAMAPPGAPGPKPRENPG